METKAKTAAEKLQDALKPIMDLASKIEKANYTLDRQTELCNIYGGFASPSTLAIHAARLILDGKLSLGWVK